MTFAKIECGFQDEAFKPSTGFHRSEDAVKTLNASHSTLHMYSKTTEGNLGLNSLTSASSFRPDHLSHRSF